MRLTLMLAKFPKNRPNGNIWIGKHRMVLKVTDRRRGQLLDDLEREKKNAFFCLHPAVDKHEEKQLYKDLEETIPPATKTWFRMRKAVIESDEYAPRPLSQHYNPLNKDMKW